jgi:hypothetical protein
MRYCLFIFSCLAVLLTGCVQYDYVGQKFPANKDGKISFYDADNDVPRDHLRLIGRMTMVCDVSLDRYDVQVRLLEKAREYGADAVSLYSVRKVREDVIDDPELPASLPDNDLNPMGVDMNGTPYEVNSFGQQVTVSEQAYYDWIIQALFWKERKAADAYLSQFKGKLKDNGVPVVKKAPAEKVKAPAAKKPVPPQK